MMDAGIKLLGFEPWPLFNRKSLNYSGLHFKKNGDNKSTLKGGYKDYIK